MRSCNLAILQSCNLVILRSCNLAFSPLCISPFLGLSCILAFLHSCNLTILQMQECKTALKMDLYKEERRIHSSTYLHKSNLGLSWVLALTRLQECKISRSQDSPKNGLIYRGEKNQSIYIYKSIFRAVFQSCICKIARTQDCKIALKTDLYIEERRINPSIYISPFLGLSCVLAFVRLQERKIARQPYKRKYV